MQVSVNLKKEEQGPLTKNYVSGFTLYHVISVTEYGDEVIIRYKRMPDQFEKGHILKKENINSIDISIIGE